MSTTKHTPGEWAHTDGSIYSYGVGHGADIATVNTDSAHFTDEEAEANARLIAAAPDLLQALKVIRSVLNDWNKEGNYTNLIEHANTAINKAIGE